MNGALVFQGSCYAWGSAPNPVLRREGEGTALFCQGLLY